MALEAQLKELKDLKLSAQLAGKLNQNWRHCQNHKREVANAGENAGSNHKNCKDCLNKRRKKKDRAEEDATQRQ